MIRLATEPDFARVVHLIHAAWAARVDVRSSGHRFTEADLQQLVNEDATLLVAHEGEMLLGCALVIPADGIAEIAKAAVHPTAFGSGVGEALIHAAQRTATDMGFAATLLAVSAYQPELVHWYARFGYVVAPDRIYEHASPNSPVPIVMMRPTEHDPVGQAARALLAGQLVGMPTETVYGLAADASNPVAVRSVFAAKGRPVDHPLIVHLASKRSLDQWTVHSDDAQLLADAFWPGPLTMVLPRQTHVLDEVTGGRDTVAIRVPGHPVALALIASLGRHAAVVAPSANPFGAVSPTTADHVRADGLASIVLDGGPAIIGVESTIVELVGDIVQILRPGAVTAAQIEAVLGRPVTSATGPSRAPGMLDSHYSPRAAVSVVRSAADATERGDHVGYLGPDAPNGLVALDAPNPYSADAVAAILYARLREADDKGLRLLYVVTPHDGPLAEAVADRLGRAAHRP